MSTWWTRRWVTSRASTSGSRSSRCRRHRPRRRVLPGDHAIGLFASLAAYSGQHRRLMGGLAGFALGSCWAPCCSAVWAGASAASIGFLEILLIGGAAFFLYRMFRARQQQPAPAYAGAGRVQRRELVERRRRDHDGGGVAQRVDLDRGLGHIQGMDASRSRCIRPAGRCSRCSSGRHRQARPRRGAGPAHASAVRASQAQCDQLRGARRTNRIEQLRVKRAEVSEAWQER